MGSFITLGIERLEVDWAKNSVARNHSRLFLHNDVKNVTYYYADEVTEQKPGYARRLRSVLKRLELLGYTIEGCQKIYADLASHPVLEERPPIAFATLQKALSRVDVRKFAVPENDPVDFDLGEYVVKSILSDPEWMKSAPDVAKDHFLDGCFLENLDPYIVLRLLAENAANLDLELAWRFSNLVEGGWIETDRLYEPLSPSDKFLLVTEGSTDTNILRKSLALVEPDVSDFFGFVDMAENYPFTGTGNVIRFCEGLCKINILNRVLVVLDNDTAGRAAAERLQKLRLPPQIRTLVLPDLKKCSKVKTLGPSGENLEDVNGRAVSIEFFLDLNYDTLPKPGVRWTSYDQSQDAYQGELVAKDAYVRAFFDVAGKSKNYDVSDLAYLWRNILTKCVGPWD
jgi:hypothetical protein